MKLALHALRKHNLTNAIHVVHDGAEALDFVICREAYRDRDIGDPPKVILLDLKMPLVDGLEVLQQIREDPRTRMIPIVMMTASREEQDRVES